MLPTNDAIRPVRSPEVSVVLPSYNHSQFIVQAIESVLQQTMRNWELIVIDDGSGDGTPDLLEQRYGKHPQIRLVYQTNRGAHHAINRGMDMATGRYISILNSDDIYHPERLQTLLDHCHSRSDALVFTPVSPIDGLGQPITDPNHPWCRLYARLSRAYVEEGFRQALLTGNFAVSTSNFFFRTDLLQHMGGFRKKRYNHDWDFMARLVRQGREIACVGDQALLFYRLHGNNTITQNTLMARVELKRILHGLVPADDLYLASLFSRMTLNMRSIRREHEERLAQQFNAQVLTLSAELQAVTQERARMAQQLEAVQQHLEAVQQHLALIRGSRSYRLSRYLMRVASLFRPDRSDSKPSKQA